jgi:hypothetical protein
MLGGGVSRIAGVVESRRARRLVRAVAQVAKPRTQSIDKACGTPMKLCASHVIT